MVDIIFIYISNKYLMKDVDKNEIIINVLRKYSRIINFSVDELNFFYRGKLLTNLMNKKIGKLNHKTINIFVTKINKPKQNEIINTNILCSLCHSRAKLNLEEEDKISLYDCIQKHKISGLTIKEFIESQKIEEKIRCDICGISKINCGKNFYINSEEKIICRLCSYRLSNELMIEYNSFFNKCKNHFNEYISYCDTCKKNMCQKCEEVHAKHKILLFKKIFPDTKIKSILSEIEQNKKNMNIYLHELRKIKALISEAIKNEMKYSDNYINLCEAISGCLKNTKNYETLNNILNFKFKNVRKDISNFLKDTLNDKIKFILKKFKESKEGIATYGIKDNDSKIKIFGKDFVENNKENCFLLKNSTIYDIEEYYSLNKEKNNLQIKVIMSENMESMKGMFSDCLSFLSFPSISEWNTINIKEMSGIFNNCTQLDTLPDISKWNTKNVSDMSYMFNNCSSLKCLPDISKWNTENVSNMSYMFNNCSSLKYLPNISKWNTKTVIDMSNIFNNCSSLEILPDISKWNIKNVIYLNSLFKNCKALKKLPDINKWDTTNTISMSSIFYNCISLFDLPDISHWKTSKVTDISSIFFNCNNLEYLPDISGLNTKNIKYLNSIFENCEKLKRLPDISHWNTSNAINLSNLFSNCKSLIYMPDISKWNISKVKDISYLFYNCHNLPYLPDISKWNIKMVNKFDKMFCGCTSLNNINNIPNISIWNLPNEKYKKMYNENSVFYTLINDAHTNFLINFRHALKNHKIVVDNKTFHLEILTSRDILRGIEFQIFNMNESKYSELFDSSLNIQGDFLLSFSLNGLEKIINKEYNEIKKKEILKSFFDIFCPVINISNFERKYKDKKDLIICEFFPKKYKKNELYFDTELINYFKYLRLNIICKSQTNYEDLLHYQKDNSATTNPKIVSRLLSFFFSFETNFCNVKIIKDALNEALERSKINREEYMNLHLLSSFIYWISSFIRGKLKLEINPKSLLNQFIDQNGEDEILRFFRLFLGFTSNLLLSTICLYGNMKTEAIEKLKLDEITINFAIPKYKNGLVILYKIPNFSKAIAEQKKYIEQMKCLIY